MSTVSLIKPEFGPDSDIPGTLRNIAKAIEAGEHGVITTCLVVTGHTYDRPAEGGKVQGDDFEVFGCGPRCDAFTMRGLLLTAATRPIE